MGSHRVGHDWSDLAVVYIYITHLPSQSGNKVYKWLFPNIHFYCSDASYDFTHGPDPVVCESCSLTPEGTDVRRALVTTAQLSLAAAAGVGTGAGLGIKRFFTAFLHLEHSQVLLKVQMEKRVSVRKSNTQPLSRSSLENVQHRLRKTWNESDTNHLLKEVTVR